MSNNFAGIKYVFDVKQQSLQYSTKIVRDVLSSKSSHDDRLLSIPYQDSEIIHGVLRTVNDIDISSSRTDSSISTLKSPAT